MKLIKRLLSLILSILVVLAMLPIGVAKATLPPSSPPTTCSITMQDLGGNTKTTSLYSAYQIIEFDVSTLGGNTVYTNMILKPEYKSAIIAALSLANNLSDSEIIKAISVLPDKGAEIAALAIALRNVTPASPTATAINGVFTNLGYGYYLIIETENNANDGTVISKPLLVGVPDSAGDYDINIMVKTSAPTIEKKIVEKDAGGFDILVDSSTAAVGDTVTYQSLSTIPTYPTHANNITYYVTDTLSAGLDYNSDIVAKIVGPDGTTVIETLDSGTDYILTNPAGKTFRVELKNNADIKNWGNAGNQLLITYSATLVGFDNKYGSTGYPNSINLTYGNQPGHTTTTPDDTVITYTNKLIITKVDDTTNAPLAGAKFELYKMDGGIYPLAPLDTQITGNNGIASFTTLEQGTYKLVETEAPTGYSKLSDPIEFTVSANNNGIAIPSINISGIPSGNLAALSFTATWACSNTSIFVESNGTLSTNIENAAGFTLPGTGGIGTTIFTVIGIIIILIGGCLLFVYYKKNKEAKPQ